MHRLLCLTSISAVLHWKILSAPMSPNIHIKSSVWSKACLITHCTLLVKLFPYFHLNEGVRILVSNIYSCENMNVKQAERGRKVIFRAFTRLCFYSNSRMFDLLEWVSFPQVKLENILSHPALNTSGVERHMQLKLAVCVCVRASWATRLTGYKILNILFPLFTELEICRPQCAT